MTAQSIARIVAATGRSADDALATIAGRNPQKRLIEPDEVAAAVAYLCSDAARGVNGTSMLHRRRRAASMTQTEDSTLNRPDHIPLWP